MVNAGPRRRATLPAGATTLRQPSRRSTSRGRTPAEPGSVAPGRSRSRQIHTFVEQADIDPIFYQKSYDLAPGSEETAGTYALLRDAMADADRVAVGTLVMRGKQYLAAIRAHDGLL